MVHLLYRDDGPFEGMWTCNRNSESCGLEYLQKDGSWEDLIPHYFESQTEITDLLSEQEIYSFV